MIAQEQSKQKNINPDSDGKQPQRWQSGASINDLKGLSVNECFLLQYRL